MPESPIFCSPTSCRPLLFKEPFWKKKVNVLLPDQEVPCSGEAHAVSIGISIGRRCCCRTVNITSRAFVLLATSKVSWACKCNINGGYNHAQRNMQHGDMLHLWDSDGSFNSATEQEDVEKYKRCWRNSVVQLQVDDPRCALILDRGMITFN